MTIATSFEQVTNNSPDGAQMGQSATEKNAFYGSTPVVQPSSANQASVSATAAAAALTGAASAAVTQVAVTDSLDGATFTGTALTTSATPTVDELETNWGVLGLQLNAAGTDIAENKDHIDKNTVDIAAQKVELDKLITDVANTITLSNQLRSELVTLGLITGS